MDKAANTGKASLEQMVLAWLLLRKEFRFLSLRARYARAACCAALWHFWSCFKNSRSVLNVIAFEQEFGDGFSVSPTSLILAFLLPQTLQPGQPPPFAGGEQRPEPGPAQLQGQEVLFAIFMLLENTCIGIDPMFLIFKS